MNLNKFQEILHFTCTSDTIQAKCLFPTTEQNIWAGHPADNIQLCIFMRKITESLEDSRMPPVTPFSVKHGCIPQLLPNAGAGE